MRLALLSALALMVAGPAAAQQWFHVDQCESYDLDGQPVQHLVFSLHNLDPYNDVREFTLNPVTYQSVDTCHTLGLAAPAGWGVAATGDRHPDWVGGPLAPGQTQGGFAMTLSRPACCFDAVFPTPVLGEIMDETWVCFDCANGATPAHPSSWGSLKAVYR